MGKITKTASYCRGLGQFYLLAPASERRKPMVLFHVFGVYHVKERRIRQYLADYCFNIANYLTMGMGGSYPRIATVT